MSVCPCVLTNHAERLADMVLLASEALIGFNLYMGRPGTTNLPTENIPKNLSALKLKFYLLS